MAELIVKIDPADVSERVLDEIKYKGKTIREWADSLTDPKTKADEIRAMSDDELANLLSPLGSCPVVADGIPFNDNANCSDDCDKCWLEWLQSPAEAPEQ